jgi:hypothetical protein
MKKLLAIIVILILAATAWAGPPITQGINTGAIGEIGATTPNRGTFTDTYWYGSGISHGMTSIAPTNDYGAAFYMSSTIGGLDLYGLTDADQLGALRLTGISGAADPTDAYAALVLRGGKKNGTGWQALGAAETVLDFYNYTTSIGRAYGNGEWILTSLQNTPIGSTIASTGNFTSVSQRGLVYWSSATAELDEGSVTLPTITANYSGHGWVRVSSAGVIQDSAEFESGSDGNVSLIRGTANVVVGAACANAKICISTAGAQNPIIVQSRNGAAQVEIEFWYH